MDLDDRELLEELIIEFQEHLGTLEPDLMALEDGVGKEETAELVNRIFRSIHSIKGGCGFLGIETVQNLTHRMESVLMKVRSGHMEVTPPLVDVLLEGTDRVKEMLDDVENCEAIDASAVHAALDPFLDENSRPAAAPVEETKNPPEVKRSGFIPLVPMPAKPVSEEPEIMAPVPVVEESKPTKTTPASSRGSSHNEVLRVKVDLLNQLMNLAGELVLARNQIVQSLDNKLADTPSGEAIFSSTRSALDDSSRRLASIINEQRQKMALDDEAARCLTDHINKEFVGLTENLMKALPTRLSDLPGMNATMVNIDAVTTNLQENIMHTRLQSVDAVFGKLPRQVRKLAKQVGKDVVLEVTGNEVELDKSIIESLSDPLTHLIRNSLDHGLEDPAGRKAAGKPVAGKLEVRAFHEGGQVNIEIEDDGRGINPDVIKQKAIEKGVISEIEADRLDDREAVALIFAPGFSTAEAVSDISGRGVGMDVVRTNIEDLGGTIELDSRWGSGTRMRLKLPLTLAIIPSLLIRVCGRRFAIPQISLDELVRLRCSDDKNRIEEVQGAEVLRLRGKLLPLIRLSNLLGMPVDDEQTTKRKATHILVLKSGKNQYGLVVDEVLDSEEIVVKQLPLALKDSRCYAGATIMGDGTVAMILDVGGIADFAKLRFTEDNVDDLDDESEAYLDRTEGQTLLLFNNTEGGETFALNLALVSRIERIETSTIETVGGKEFLKYQTDSLRLVRLEDFMPVAASETDPEEVYVIIPKQVKHPMGIIAGDCHDVITTRVEVDPQNVKGTGVLGSAVIDGNITLFLDIYSLFEAADPEAYQKEGSDMDCLDGVRVLMAEDTSFFRAVIRKYLEGLGGDVTVAKDGQEAWNILNESNKSFDLVVTDVEMPLMDGLELTRHIRSSEQFSKLPVVALTSLVSEESRKAGQEAGVTAYETKLDKDRLASTLRKVLEGVGTYA